MSEQVVQTIEKLFDFEHMTVYVMAAFLIGFFLLLFYNFIYRYREQDAKTQGLSEFARLSLVLQTSNLRLCFYNVQKRHYVFLNENGEFSKDYNPIEFAALFDRDDFEQLRKCIFDICEGRSKSANVRVRGAMKDDGSHDVFDFSVSVDGGTHKQGAHTGGGVEHGAQPDSLGTGTTLGQRLHHLTGQLLKIAFGNHERIPLAYQFFYVLFFFHRMFDV